MTVGIYNDRKKAAPAPVSQAKPVSSSTELASPVRAPAPAQALLHIPASAPVEATQVKRNETGLPDTLKAGVESLSGYSLDDVRVHYNSGKPAQLQAHAYAQGSDIHLAPGQEMHLPHEAWHVVQQKQGRVKPTIQMKGNVNVNDDVGLEKEANIMADKALATYDSNSFDLTKSNNNTQTNQLSPIQLMTAGEARGLFLSKFAIRSASSAEDLGGASFALAPTNYDVVSNSESSTMKFYNQIKASCQMMINLSEDGGYFLLIINSSGGIGRGYTDTLDKYNTASGSKILLSIPIKGHSADSLFNIIIGNFETIKNLTPDEKGSSDEKGDKDLFRKIEKRGEDIKEIEVGMEQIKMLSVIHGKLLSGGGLEKGDREFLDRIRKERELKNRK